VIVVLPVIVTPSCEVEITEMLCADGADAMDPESVAVTAKLKAPVAVGVPSIIPVLACSVMPVGSEPVDDHVYGGTPPDAVSCCAGQAMFTTQL
jgi:hypothetical protein